MKQKNYQNSTKNTLGKLPIWNLKDLYESPKAKKLNNDLNKLRISTKKFEKKYNFKNIVTKPYKKNNKTISSTFLRKKIRSGKIDEVNKLLNRKWSVDGKVIKGQRRGRKIGFPTCNLKLNDYVMPKLGVYAVKVKSKNFYKNGIANIGYRPTFNGQNLLLETNIFGISKNLYNKVISVNFKKFIRPEKKFRNLIHLKKQIKLDVKQAKK